ncbi:hypothetical protein DL771_008514 [Monosporascus sp. 5C6A]|nr:hypothetical protein DL771_008514 [Monosporascus sp. 5C6A]
MPRPVSLERAPEASENGYMTPREEHFEAGGGVVRPTNRGRARNHADSISANGFFQAHDPESLARMISNARKDRYGKKIGIRDRICCYQWTWFTMTMATGGIANVIHSIWVAYEAAWLYYIGLVFFLFNMSLFIMNCVLITMRFRMVPGSFTHSFTDQVESLFIPAVFVSTGTILINICEFGIPYASQWLVKSAVSANEHPKFNFIPMAFCAVAVQGTGFLIAFMICAAFIYRLMTQKLPRDTQRPGVFISVGPSGFTVAGLVMLGQEAEVIVPASFGDQEHAVIILRIVSNLMGLWFWGLSVWFFLVSVGSLWKYVRPEHSMPFQMTWWSFVFPNTALVTATLALATALDSAGLRVFGCVMAACLTVVWLLVFVTMLRCLWKRQLLWPKELESK